VHHFTIKNFKDLSIEELYEILQLRANVFIIEQNCIYHDIDGLDTACFHLFARDHDVQKIIAYARLVPQNLKFDVPSIGRVITDINYRNIGLGKALMNRAIVETCKLFETNKIKISAQTYLFNFYNSFGFEPISERYDEDGIEHVDMLLNDIR
jgi:ElaA protein